MEDKSKEDTIVYLGQKDLSTYTKAVMMNIEKSGECTIKTRGKHISKAVSLATYLIREKTLKYSDIEIGSEEFTGEDKKRRFVATFSVKLSK
jgi:DNA-binding protein Alba